MLSALYARKRLHDDGFTLIELLIVVIIIGILAAIALPIFIDQQKQAVDATVKSDVRNTVTNVNNWLVDNRGTAAADTAAFKAAGGKVAQSRSGSYMGVAIAADGSYTVCGYDAGSTKYTEASKAYSFNASTGKFDTAASCNGATTAAGASDPATSSTVLDYTNALATRYTYIDTQNWADNNIGWSMTTGDNYVSGYGTLLVTNGTLSGAKTAVTKGPYNLGLTKTCVPGNDFFTNGQYGTTYDLPITNVHYYDASGNDLNYVPGVYANNTATSFYNRLQVIIWCGSDTPAGRLKIYHYTYTTKAWSDANKSKVSKLTFDFNGVNYTRPVIG